MASVAVMATVIVIKDILGNTVPTARVVLVSVKTRM
jgi:hypothetical protein